ncbi:MAG TPA: hypothetical protein VGF80_09580 [Galbitalea sp.]|jgi:hypothetical protein
MPSAWDPPVDDDVGRSVPRVKPVRDSSLGGIVAAAAWCVVLGFYSAGLSFASLLIGFVSDSCGSRGPCDFTELTFGLYLGLIGCPAVAIAVVVVAVVRGTRRRAFTWVIPLVGIVVVTLVFFTAATVGFAAAGINFWNQ